MLKFLDIVLKDNKNLIMNEESVFATNTELIEHLNKPDNE